LQKAPGSYINEEKRNGWLVSHFSGEFIALGEEAVGEGRFQAPFPGSVALARSEWAQTTLRPLHESP
jgi:hypothetical protein